MRRPGRGGEGPSRRSQPWGIGEGASTLEFFGEDLVAKMFDENAPNLFDDDRIRL
jgi:hypothetical protein